MKFLLSLVSLALFSLNLSGQYFNDPIKQILDDPDSPQLGISVQQAVEAQSSKAGAFAPDAIKRNNLFLAQVMGAGQYIVAMEPMRLSMVKPSLITFLKNPSNSPMMSDSIDGSTPYTGTFYFTEGIAVAQFDPSKVEAALPLIRELASALNGYRDYLSLQAFKTNYAQVPDLGKSVIDRLMASKLIFYPQDPMQMGGVDAAPPAPGGGVEPVEGEEEVEEDLPEMGPGGSPMPSEMPDLGDLGEAAEKLKDIIFEKSGGGTQVEERNQNESESPELPGLGDHSETFNIDVVDRPPSLAACKSAPNDDESKYCFEQAVIRHVNSQFSYPEQLKALEHPPMGRIFIQFVVNTQGEISSKKAVRGIDHVLDNVALSTLNGLNFEGPATINGKAVMMYHTVVLEVKP